MDSKNESSDDDKSLNFNRKTKQNLKLKLKLQINKTNSNDTQSDSIDSSDYAKTIKISKIMDDSSDYNDTEFYNDWVITENKIMSDNLDNTKRSKKVDDRACSAFSANRLSESTEEPQVSPLKFIEDHFAPKCQETNRKHENINKTNSSQIDGITSADLAKPIKISKLKADSSDFNGNDWDVTETPNFNDNDWDITESPNETMATNCQETNKNHQKIKISLWSAEMVSIFLTL